MIVKLVAHHTDFVSEDGWLCHQPNGMVTVTRDDGSSEVMSKNNAKFAMDVEGFVGRPVPRVGNLIYGRSLTVVGRVLRRLTFDRFDIRGCMDWGGAWLLKGDGHKPPVFRKILPLNSIAHSQWRGRKLFPWL